MNDNPILTARGVSKLFPPATRALDNVDLDLRAGEIHGLLGVNGAGKSTLIKILVGVETADAGTLTIGGKETPFPDSPQVAHAAGIGVVHQELPLFPNLTAAENVFLGVQSPRFMARRQQRQIHQSYERTARLLAGAPPAGAKLSELGPDRWQIVAVIRALAAGARVLILDEPTSSLGQEERQAFHSELRNVAGLGVSVLYVSHFLDDVLDVCDVVTVLRDARVAMEAFAQGLSTGDILVGMTGESAPERRVQAARAPSPSRSRRVLSLAELETEGIGPVSLDVHAGERVGLYGLQDCGARDLLEASFGLRRHRGDCILGDHRLSHGPRQRIDAGLGYMPPERSKALIGDWSVGANLGLPALGATPSAALAPRVRERRQGEELIERFGIVGSVGDPIQTLSGGNQQKVALAKWLARGVTCLLADELTRGVDVRGRQLLYDLVTEYSENGAGVLFFSTDPEEIVALCHRVHILEQGRLSHTLEGDEVTVEALEHLGRVHTPTEDKEEEK